MSTYGLLVESRTVLLLGRKVPTDFGFQAGQSCFGWKVSTVFWFRSIPYEDRFDLFEVVILQRIASPRFRFA